ncbi:uncharacterized protein MYCFIDRAFT_210423 [Pseudocercospora fijiensis CIRAD86]|uniref:rRNA-processing protein FYV7 n=1 Tax=Pseudocercospora fijiensis (strain CIRAD86) TaxID=383855 RepID=M3ANH1_PSEFD|nr:uncharacterized protein MYCFIDRAFT_210423 [Pseudocercospora fijiensis CIRAD86]EME86146.1 hypothetical protein MYCFIDRAFT_210423 [Pseudocercospora fijiensis CIRAD86]
MPEARKRDRDEAGAKDARKRQKRGFVVGPGNLPDGAYKRKTQEIKQSLIAKAKLRKKYEKLRKEGKVAQEEDLPMPASLAVEEDEGEGDEPTTAPHPDRQNLIEEEAEAPEDSRKEVPRRKRREKFATFSKEHEQARRRKAEAEERRKAREEAERQRQKKIEEREKFRKAMAKARGGGRNGQRKLGRESQPLLEKVKRLMGESG